jgi:hypothetical protein
LTRRVTCVVIGVLCLSAPRARGESKITAIFDLYDRGRYADAIAGIPALGKPQDVLAALQHDTMPWIRDNGPAAENHRSLVAATVALEVARTNALDYRSHVAVVSWACEIVRHFQTMTPAPAERWWFLASIAVMEHYGGARYLIGKPAFESLASTGAFDRTADSRNDPEWETGHLSHAQARFPEEPTFRLKRTEALETTTIDIRTPSEGNNNIRFDAIPPDYRAKILPIARGRFSSPEPNDRQLSEMQRAALDVWLFDQLPRLTREFTEHAKTPELAAEAELHLGHLEIRRGAWDEAVQHLSRVSASTTDPTLLYLGAYMQGWAEQRRGHLDEAVAAYRAALRTAPHAKSAAVLLSAALIQIGESAEAYAVLDDAVKKKPDAPDPWDDLYSGDWPRLPTLINHLREALR